MKNTQKISIALVVVMCIAAFSSIAITSAATQPTVVMLYSNLGMSEVYWGNTLNILRSQGWTVVSLMPASADPKIYEPQIEQQMHKTPGAIYVSFSDSDVSLITAVYNNPSLVKRVIFVESTPDITHSSLSDIAIMATVLALRGSLPFIYAPVFSALGGNRWVVSTMLDSMVLKHPANFEDLVSATTSSSSNGPLFALQYLIAYQPLNWGNAITSIRNHGVPMTAIYSDNSPDAKSWALINAIPSFVVTGAKHLIPVEQNQAFTNTLIAEMNGCLA
jgi:hypothetical protein